MKCECLHISKVTIHWTCNETSFVEESKITKQMQCIPSSKSFLYIFNPFKTQKSEFWCVSGILLLASHVILKSWCEGFTWIAIMFSTTFMWPWRWSVDGPLLKFYFMMLWAQLYLCNPSEQLKAQTIDATLQPFSDVSTLNQVEETPFP